MTMTSRPYTYTLQLPVRVRGAIGIASMAEYSVVLRQPTATFAEVFAAWQEAHGTDWDPMTPQYRSQFISVCGFDAQGCGERRFEGVPADGGDDRDCYEINAEYLGID
jgi:hypothetical protein